ncbi:unnamed protein product [Onchocerca ochengi]|uniref:HORMA domain-containing protein n=1 Tax=Onchocerca ochengi TaxID=42157 RepID=A0A182ERU4_ONCOC|nr:unnamed protein product [Onchocerca ochengi]
MEWEATFPNEPVGEKSRSFLQRVVFIAASHILYSRGLLPAKCFKKRQIEKFGNGNNNSEKLLNVENMNDDEDIDSDNNDSEEQ